MKKLLLLSFIGAAWSAQIVATSLNIWNNTNDQVSIGSNGNNTSCLGIAGGFASVLPGGIIGSSMFIGAVAGEDERDTRPYPDNKFVIDIPTKTNLTICRIKLGRGLRVWLTGSAYCFQGQSNDFYQSVVVPDGQIWSVSIQPTFPGQKLRDMVNGTDVTVPGVDMVTTAAKAAADMLKRVAG